MAGCGGRSDSHALIIAEQGSFAVGGTVLKDSLEHTYHGDHVAVIDRSLAFTHRMYI